MTKFNPENRDNLTIGETLAPAMEITDQDDAAQYLKDLTAYTQKKIDEGKMKEDGKTAEEIAKSNLAYYAGYYSNETRERVERLFKCEHPIFGSFKKNGELTDDQVLANVLSALDALAAKL